MLWAYRVKTAKWIGDCFVYTNAANRLNYLVGQQSHTITQFDKYVPRQTPPFTEGFLTMGVLQPHVSPGLYASAKPDFPCRQASQFVYLLALFVSGRVPDSSSARGFGYSCRDLAECASGPTEQGSTIPRVAGYDVHLISLGKSHTFTN